MTQVNADVVDTIIKIGGFLGACYVCFQLPTTVFKRLAIIANRQMALMGMFISVSGRITDLENVLAKKIGYKPGGTIQEVEAAFKKQFESDDTGF
ncbi:MULTISPECIES: hypothetical protein [unclassified Microcoleus]|uniref:hypothetical protein n=1 Tax=unclassified Microcoleus TaxID=2642155 RepID=UPI002FD661A7